LLYCIEELGIAAESTGRQRGKPQSKLGYFFGELVHKAS